MALLHVDPVIHCSPLLFPPLKIALSLSFSLALTLSDMGVCWEQTKFTTQLLLIKTRQKGASKRQRETKCSFVKAGSFVYCHD